MQWARCYRASYFSAVVNRAEFSFFRSEVRLDPHGAPGPLGGPKSLQGGQQGTSEVGSEHTSRRCLPVGPEDNLGLGAAALLWAFMHGWSAGVLQG